MKGQLVARPPARFSDRPHWPRALNRLTKGMGESQVSPAGERQGLIPNSGRTLLSGHFQFNNLDLVRQVYILTNPRKVRILY